MAFDDEILVGPSAPQVPIEVLSLGTELVSVTVRGDIDLSEAGELRAVLNDACTGPHRTVQLDLGEVRFMGSSGMGVIVGAYQRMAGEGRRLEVLHVSPAIRSAFGIAGVDFALDG
ncbi:MAG: STAS domain-containing protein [Acidimicrobiales bacterium]